MARAVLYADDLLFGSNVLGALRAGGHQAVQVSRPDDLPGALAESQVLIVDLTADAPARIALARSAVGDDQPVPILAFFAHVEHDVRAQAEQAGFDLVVPRSRMARSAAELVSRLARSDS